MEVLTLPKAKTAFLWGNGWKCAPIWLRIMVLNKQPERQLDGSFTHMLRWVVNVHWEQHMTNKQLYGDLQPLTETKIRRRRLKLAGHCERHHEEIAGQVLLWEPIHGNRKRGRPAISYVDCLKRDTGLKSVEKLRRCMVDRSTWRTIISARERHPP